MHYARWYRHGSTDSHRKVRERCVVEGCEQWRDSHGFCPKHLRRWKLYGDPLVTHRDTYVRNGRIWLTPGGYEMTYEPEHPMAKSRRVLVHRKVLYDAIGPGSHPCHHCGREVTWGLKSKRQRLEVDHLDGDRRNNDLSNLVPSCNTCNDGQAKRRRTHCQHGHEYTPENTYIRANGNRVCRECARASDRKRRPPGTPR